MGPRMFNPSENQTIRLCPTSPPVYYTPCVAFPAGPGESESAGCQWSWSSPAEEIRVVQRGGNAAARD